MTTDAKPTIKVVVDVETETEKAYLLRVLEFNGHVDTWLGTSTKSWFPKSQVQLKFTRDVNGKDIILATIQKWIADKNGILIKNYYE